MAKDKEGHGSEAHREGHKPQVEHGKYEKGTEHHDQQTIEYNRDLSLRMRNRQVGSGMKFRG